MRIFFARENDLGAFVGVGITPTIHASVGIIMILACLALERHIPRDLFRHPTLHEDVGDVLPLATLSGTPTTVTTAMKDWELAVLQTGVVTTTEAFIGFDRTRDIADFRAIERHWQTGCGGMGAMNGVERGHVRRPIH